MSPNLAVRRLILRDRDLLIFGPEQDPYFTGISVEAENDFILLIESALPPAGIFVDIGANIGLTTLIATSLKPECSVIAIEAAPTIAATLQHNITANSLDKVELHNVAAGSSNGYLNFLEHSAYGHVVTEGDVSHAGLPHDTIEVPVRRIDDIIGMRHVDVIKIDVEGFEESVFAGLSATEARCQPMYFIEFNAWTLSAMGRVNPMDFMERLIREFDYVSHLGISGRWERLDAVSCIHIVFLGFQAKITNLACTNDLRRIARMDG